MGEFCSESESLDRCTKWLTHLDIVDYMFETTTPSKGETLADEKVNGSIALLLLDLCVKVLLLMLCSTFVRHRADRSVIQDKDIDALVFHVKQFCAPSTDIFAPWVLFRLLAFAIKRKAGFA